ncbi:hypothetical protein QW71_12965 [Paenibacillus sp. IHB B 3415]|uniref:hypothetical protein n=1 Tax=Paenibacillus sp. IHB B 3415 TaxID=867080 RepID=UPI000574AFA1|nr:hypothetical protein [Paenibacillus sp. IHB B 3415]KHL95369.1 hypothetical protein QW71_12965 [Paenibacillus sp. IHB B 3415]
MSLVSIIATEQFISVVTDGREMRNGEVVGEQHPKCMQFSNILIAYAGVKQPAEIVISLLEKEGVLERGDLAEIATYVQHLFNAPALKTFKLLFAFGGLDTKGEITFHTIDSTHKILKKFTPKNGQVSFAVLGNQDAANLFQHRLAQIEAGLSMTEAQSIQTEINEQVSKNAIGVNNTLFKFFIEKS